MNLVQMLADPAVWVQALATVGGILALGNVVAHWTKNTRDDAFFAGAIKALHWVAAFTSGKGPDAFKAE